MDEQPVPDDDQWPWSSVFWSLRRRRAETYGSVRILHGVRECCTQCGEMIFADKIACVVTLHVGQKWLALHFHRACYVAWERAEQRAPAERADNVVALSARPSAPRADPATQGEP